MLAADLAAEKDVAVAVIEPVAVSAAPVGAAPATTDVVEEEGASPAADADGPRAKRRRAANETAVVDGDGPTEAAEATDNVAEEEVEKDVANVEEAATPFKAAAAAPVAEAVTPAEAYEDRVRLWEPGWRERYYVNKFRVQASDVEFVRELVRAYAAGVSWVMLYYYQGCPSWKWYFPQHYSPFATDFSLLGEYRPRFERGQPFRPLEQLMAVFPPASKDLIPEPLRPLMLDDGSPILDFYPTSFEIDMNGKTVRGGARREHSARPAHVLSRYRVRAGSLQRRQAAWQGVALLPFVDEDRLLKAVQPLYSKLAPEDRRLNEFGNDLVFVSKASKLFETICDLYGGTVRGVMTRGEAWYSQPQLI